MIRNRVDKKLAATVAILATCLLTLFVCGSLLYQQVVLPGNVIPTAPLPPNSSRLERTTGSATESLWYTEKYSVELSVDEVLEYYKVNSKNCRQLNAADPHIVVDNYIATCIGPATPIGTFEVQIGSAENSAGQTTVLIIMVQWGVPF